MTREEAILYGEEYLNDLMAASCDISKKHKEFVNMAIKALEQEPCEDCISRQALDEIKELMTDINGNTVYAVRMSAIRKLPPVTPKPKPNTGHCKECKYFEYDSVAKVDGIPLIVAHEICKKWGDGCKTNENGYCFLFEPKMSEISIDSENEG